MKRAFRRPAFLLLSFLLSHSPAVAQNPGSAISGAVSDAEGGRIPRAPVRLLDSTGVVVAQTLCDARGNFRFDPAPAGAASLAIELAGFAAWSHAAKAGDNIEVKLALAPVRERIVVTATRTETPTAQLGASITVVSREEIEERSLLRVADIFSAVPGATLAQNGPPGSLASLFVRGGESDHNRVFLDGVPINEPGGAFSFANFTLLNVDRVEVLRGPQSALFGSDALGSTVQVFTRRGTAEDTRPHFSLSLEGGNHHTLNGSAAVTGEAGRFDYSSAVSRFLTDNDAVNQAYRNTSLSNNFGIALGRSSVFRVILQGNAATAGTPGQIAYTRPDTDARIKRADGVASFSLQTEAIERWRQRFAYDYSRTRYRSLNLFDDPPPFSDFLFDNTNDTRRHRASWQSDYTFHPAHTFTAAFEYEREKGKLISIFPAFPAFSPPDVIVHRTNVGGVLQQQSLFAQRFAVTAGVRIESSTSFGTEATPRVSLAHTVRHGNSASALGATKLKFNFGTGIKEPTFLENYSLSFGFMGNPNLQPERVRSFDFGIEQRLAADRAKLEINWFDNRFRDLIAFVNTTFVNISRTRANGAEVIFEARPMRHLRGVGTYTYLNSQVTASNSPADPIIGVGRPLLRRPRHSGSLVLVWDGQRFTVSSTTRFVGRRVDSDFQFPSLGITSNPGYARWDLAASFRSSHRVTYFAAFENLANDRYEEVLGYPALGRSVRAGLRWEY